ncbi:MAG: hypothetical protein QNJ55_33420 [Xenococcus sp. MO_188.B8]|nr:hypothetical protein [Xenococcus sp. MO_188.B8]
MKHRFYTFYDFTGYPPFRASMQSQLKRKIERLASTHPEWQEVDYIEYFRQIVLNNSESELERRFAHWHLVAYIDRDRCFLIWREFHHISLYAAKSDYFYALTNEILFQIGKFKKYLSKYNDRDRSQASLKTYILGVLENSIREKLDLQSGWHLLCNVDISSTRKINNFGKKIQKSLAEYGINEPSISQYVFAWQYFIAVYKNNKIYQFDNRKREKWPEPDNCDFAEAAKYYNIQKNQPHAPLQVSSSLEVTAEIIEKWMTICIQALQNAKRIIEVSLDNTNYEKQQEVEVDNWQFVTGEKEKLSELEQIEIILEKEIENIEANLALIRSKIPLKARKAIMPLCYSYRLAIFTQEQLASWLGINQGTISRYISKQIETPLLKRLQELLKNKFNVQSYLKIFLAERFTNPNNSILDRLIVEVVQSLDAQQQTIIRWQYGERLTLSEINSRLGKEQNIERDKLIAIENEIQIEFREKIARWQSEYIKFWLRNYYEDKIREVLVSGFKQLESLQQEIIQRLYCQQMSEETIIKLYPQYPVIGIIAETKNQLKDFLLQWLKINFGIILPTNNYQVMEIIKNWLSRELIYLEL